MIIYNNADKSCDLARAQPQILNSYSTRPSWGGSCIEDNKLKYGGNNKVSSSSRDEEINKRVVGWTPIEATSYRPALKPCIAISSKVQIEETKPRWNDEREKQHFHEKHDFNIGSQKRTSNGRDPREKRDQGTINSMNPIKDAKVLVDTSSTVSTSNYTRHYKMGSFSLTPTVLVNLNNSMDHEKLWHYLDPSGTIQGPFSIEQLRKWNGTGLFPIDLRIWKTTEEKNQSILLTDGLQGKFNVEHDHQCRVVEGSNETCQTSISLTPSNMRHSEIGVVKRSSHVMFNTQGPENIKPNGLVQLCQPIDMHVANHELKNYLDVKKNDQTISGGTSSCDRRLEDVENLQKISLEVSTEGYDNKDEGQSSKGQIDSKTPCKFHKQGYCWKGKTCGYWHK